MTVEEHVAYTLLEYYQSSAGTDIISFHPPSGKAYGTSLIRFPVSRDRDAGASRRRHVDFILRCGRFLILQELKADSAHLTDDFLKLEALVSDFPLPALLDVISRRVPRIGTPPPINRIVLSVGYSENNGHIPARFTGFQVDLDRNIQVHWGADLSPSETRELSLALNSSKD
jgi:hypothetical protein